MVSIKVDKILSKAYELSNLSTQNFNHAAIITKGSKPITFGINNNRSMINGKMAICSHAEVHAILKWRNSHFRGVKDRDRKAKKYDLYVIRRNNNGEQSFSNSQPCKTCAKECEIQAIAPNGEINMRECHYCLDCQVTYFNEEKCPPLKKLAYKNAKDKKDQIPSTEVAA